MRPVGIDLFAGAGGFSLGFEQAGFDVKIAIDNDPIHCAVHHFNFPSTIVIPANVETLTGDAIRKSARLTFEEVDCVFGGAPCQGFSLMGQRALEDPRNRLVLDFVRLVHELEAKSFVFENVKGLTIGEHRVFLNELVDTFDRLGYECRLPWRVLNAGYFGTPQSRERFILIGARSGCAVPDYPQPTTNIAGKPAVYPDLPSGPSCADAIGDLPDAESVEALSFGDEVRTLEFSDPSEYAAELRCLKNDPWHYGYPRDWDPHQLTSSSRTQHREPSRRRFQQTKEGTVEPISRLFRLPRGGVSNTLRAGTDGSRGSFTSPRPIHYHYARCITVREMARLHGFPDWFRLHATKWHGARQIGNAVPPPLARAIAAKVMEALGTNASKPDRVEKLGDPQLLRLSFSKAMEHFRGQPLPEMLASNIGATSHWLPNTSSPPASRGVS